MSTASFLPDARREADFNQVLGPTLLLHLHDTDVQEVVLNPDGRLWTIQHSGNLTETGDSFEPQRAEALLTAVAGLLDEELTRDRPTLECELPLDGSRLAAVLPPLAPAPTFTIRKHPRVVYRLSDYVAAGALPGTAAQLLKSAVLPQQTGLTGLNVVIAGGPGSGKTTLANSLLAELATGCPQPLRIVMVEDTLELQCKAPCTAIFRTNDTHGLRELVKIALRHRPQRLVVGEVRGGEALDLLEGWYAGTGGGIATVHANSAVDALHRLDHLAQEAGVPTARWRVAHTVDLVVFIELRPSGRKVTEVIRVRGLAEDGSYLISDLMENPG